MSRAAVLRRTCLLTSIFVRSASQTDASPSGSTKHCGLKGSRSEKQRADLTSRFLLGEPDNMNTYFSRCHSVIAYCVLVGFVLGLEDGPDRPVFGAPGSPVRLSESDPGVLKAIQFAEERYNMGSNAMHLRRVSKIISASKQVTLYYKYINIYNVFNQF